MRHLVIAAAALAVSGVLATSSARAETLFEAGGPVKVGNMCKTTTDTFGRGHDANGYYSPCPKPAKVAKRGKKSKQS